MAYHCLLVVTLLVAPHDAPTPAASVARVTHAIEVDSVAPLRAQLQGLLRRAPADRSVLFQLATLERLTYRPDSARLLYSRVLSADSIQGDPIGIAALIGLARLDLDAGRWDVVQGRLRLAAARAAESGQATLEAEALLELAPVVARTTSTASGDSLLLRVAVVLPDTSDRLWARLHCARAGPPRQPGELEEGDEALAGVARARRAGDRRIEALCLTSYAKALFRRGLVDSALVINGQAMAKQQATHDGSGLAASLQWQGYALVAAREYGPARRTLLAALDASRASGNWLPAGVALMSLTSLSVRFGELGGARRYAAWGDSLLEVQGNERSRAGLMAVRGDIARASGDTAAARRSYAAAMTLAQRFGGYGTVAPARGLSALARQAGDWPTAAAQLDSARTAAKQQGMKDWARRLDYDAGTLALAQGDLATAEREYANFLAGLPVDDRLLALPARLHLAEIAARRGSVVRAESLANAAFDDFDAWRAKVDDRTLRLQALALRELDLEPGIGLPFIVRAVAAEGRGESALALIERERAREIIDAQLRLGSWAGTGSPVAGGGARNRLTRPDAATAIVEFLVGGPNEPTLAFVLTARGVQVVQGPPASGLASGVARFRSLIESGSDPLRLDRGLTAAVVGNVFEAVPAGVTTLVIVPDGALHRLPFDALRLGGGLIIDRYAVVLVPSVSAIPSAAGGGAGVATRVLAIGNPSLPAVPQPSVRAETELFRRAFADAGGLPPLPASEGEARRAARVSGGSTVRLRSDASEAWLKQAQLQKFGLIHIAAHAVVSDDDLGGSAVALAPGGGEDGFVTAADLAALSLRADLVVLSGCRTAGGVVVFGEGIQGLTAPLLRAGARSVLATSWTVRDDAAARFTNRFYGELERNGEVAPALARAKRASRAAGQPASVWAGFVLVGDPFTRVAVPAVARAGG